MGLTRITAQQISDIDYKQAVRVITLTNITLSGGAPSSVDDVNLVADDRILVAGQSTGSQNGLYRVQTVGAGSNGTWVRTSDGNATGEIEAGMIVMVTEGTSYADTQWKLITNNPIIIGTTALEFEQSSAYSFGTITANSVGIVADTVGDTVTFTPGNNFIISGNASTDTITFEVNQSPDFTGTVSTNNFSISGNVTGNLLPSANVTYNLGSPTQRWNEIFLAGQTIDIGGATISADLVTGSLILTGPDGAEFILTGSDADNALGAFGFLSAGNTEPSISTTTGAITTAGGVGIAGNIYAGGLADITGNITGGNLVTAGNVTAAYFLGNVSQASGIFATKIFNGTSEANIVSSGGNLEISIGGSADIVVVSSTGLETKGTLTATGNISGDNILGNGAGLSGINVFSNVAIAGGDACLADSIADTLIFSAGTGIAITADPDTDIITISAAGAGESIFATGGDMETVTDVVVNTVDLGLVTEAITLSNDLGSIVTAGVLYPDLLYIGDIADLFILGGTSGQYLGTSGSGVMQWQTLDSAPLLGNLTGNIQGNGYSILNVDTLTSTSMAATSISASGTLTVASIENANGDGVGNIGNASVGFNTVFAKATSAEYADLAEKYIADQYYAPGTVVVFGGDKEVTISTIYCDHRVAGVVSTNPSFIMNSALESDFVVTVALTGRVPTFVYGPVCKGDLIVSDINGTGRACNQPSWGTIIGKSLEDFDGDHGMIEVVVGVR